MSWSDVTPEQARDLLQENADLVVLDVRTAPEFTRHRIPGARLLPVHELPGRTHELDPDAAYLVVCEHGVRSVGACEFLAGRDFASLRNLQGGMAVWLAGGLEAERG